MLRPVVQNLSKYKVSLSSLGYMKYWAVKCIQLPVLATYVLPKPADSDLFIFFSSLGSHWILNSIPPFLYHFSLNINCLPSIFLPKLKF